ncbi:uncharacterized protein LOC130749741 [Lotus japonicus]|uniref:uncharacterized protein LOC130749741 n=1 Tax=Lotus japonicus TaxID=34305 RepID=UPI0025874973|nr:uncharacterized protein LOC130749741 [Lotus japonicus]
MNKNNVLQYSTQLQVWNNAAFDRGEGEEDLTMINTSWSSDCTKENLSPTTALNTTRTTSLAKFKNRDEKIIDDEIVEIEGEIKRLTKKLEALRLEKAERRRIEAASEKRVSVGGGGRVVAAKFMEPKRNGGVLRKKVEEATPKRNVLVPKRIEEETPKQSGGARVNWRRGMSLGPAEIAARAAVVPPATTPSRRKSCFWKTVEVGEERGKTVGSRKSVRKRGEGEIAVVVQPRNLFNEGEKSVPVSSSKKGMKPGRVVASRYSQGIGNSGAGGGDVRKRSLPENNRVGSEVRVKKRWEIPAEGGSVNGKAVLLPKIRTLRCVNESPRDSGAAKRVAELTGKRAFFGNEEEEEEGVCQALSFVEEDDGEDKVMN